MTTSIGKITGGVYVSRECWRLEALEDAGGAHSTTDAHGNHAVAGVAARELANQGSGEFRAGAAQGVPQGNGAAIGIHASRIEIGLLNDGQGLRREGFVKFNDGDVVE